MEYLQACVTFLSPHLDDAVVSCGGTISRLGSAGVQVWVVTVFAGSPAGELSSLAEWLHKIWGLGYDAPGRRREENDRALADLGARSACLSFLDSIYRQDPASGRHLYSSKEDIFAGRRERESALLPALVEELGPLLDDLAPQLVCAPLGAGGHVDHLAVRLAAERACEQAGAGLVLYEDLPYALDATALLKARRLSEPAVELSLVVPFGETELHAKEQAIRFYRSQSAEVAGQLALPVDDVSAYACWMAPETGAFGERYWASEPAPLQLLAGMPRMA
jgi:LmbE family N-acetylglucosaminyl deacetylase